MRSCDGPRVGPARWAAGVACCLAVPLAGCTSDDAPPRAAATSTAPERVRAVLDGVELELEVADDERERSVGLMRRTAVPTGTGMLFRYDSVTRARFFMYDVPVPLQAVFLRGGRVVSSVVMPPCEAPRPADCPTYGADEPFDTVVETAPGTLPDVRPGDVLELSG